MGLAIKIFVDWDPCAGVLTHNVLAPPALPTPVPMLSVEMVATCFWPPGKLLNQHKLTDTVTYSGFLGEQNIAQRGHDLGMLIFDITPPMMANCWYAVMWPLSSRQVKFGASTVKMDGEETGLTTFFLPMMTCGDPISAPTAIPLPTQLFHNTTVGMTCKDFWMGFLEILIAVAIDLIFFGISMKKSGVKPGDFLRSLTNKRLAYEIAGTVAGDAATSVLKQIGREYMDKFNPFKDGEKIAKTLANATGGLVTSSLRGDPTFKVGTGIPQLGGELSWQSSESGAGMGGSGINLQGDGAGYQVSTSDNHTTQRWGEAL